MTEKLKREVMTLASYLGAGEALTADDAKASMREMVAHICADKGTNQVVMALIAVELATYIDTMGGT